MTSRANPVEVCVDADIQRAALVTPSGRYEFADLRADCFGWRDVVARGSELAAVAGGPLEVLASIAALEDWCSTVHLLPDESLVGALGWADANEVTVAIGGRYLVRTAPQPDAVHTGTTRWMVYTSGTTGVPKAIGHDLSSLTRTVRASAGSYVWGLLYDPNRMAGLQVLLQAFVSQSSVVAPDRHSLLVRRVEFLRENGVTALSATPTIWRQILQTNKHLGWGLAQITLGGEIADQAILDALRAAFPDARVTHVFASTETAAAFGVSDGKAGFPVSYLVEPPAGIELRVTDDHLEVRNPGSSVADRDGFVSTGDVVEITGNRVMFKGRASGVVNVGGVNVWPEQVEAVLRQHPDIQEVAVSSVSNPLSGNLFVAKVVANPGVDGEQLRRGIRRWVRERAANALVPARVDVVDELEVNATGKIVR